MWHTILYDVCTMDTNLHYVCAEGTILHDVHAVGTRPFPFSSPPTLALYVKEMTLQDGYTWNAHATA